LQPLADERADILDRVGKFILSRRLLDRPIEGEHHTAGEEGSQHLGSNSSR
jgi:hypothetical protein